MNPTLQPERTNSDASLDRVRQVGDPAAGQVQAVNAMMRTPPSNDDLAPAMMGVFLGDSTADILGVGLCDLTTALLDPLRVANAVLGETLRGSEALSRVHEALSRKLIEGLTYVRRGGQRIPFNIPTELRRAWGVNWVA